MIGFKKSQALIITIGILAVLMIIGVSLLLITLYEARHSRIYLDAVKAQYVAEAGVVLASSLLALDQESGAVIDSLKDGFYDQIRGDDADLDADGENESKWFIVEDSKGGVHGRFAVDIIDEASKLNVNYCGEGSYPSYGLSFKEINIDSLLASLGIGKSGSLHDLLFGEDGKPGEAGVDDDSDNLTLSYDGMDNDLDSAFDEAGEGVDEYDEYGFGDDRLFLAAEQAQSMLDVPDDVRFKDYFTVYSKDREEDLWGNRRVHVNSKSAPDVALNCLLSGISLQKAANFIDYQDKDLVQTLVDKFYKAVSLPSPSGGGFFSFGGYFRAPAGSGQSTFALQNLGISDGEYFCFFYSPVKNGPVGYVSAGSMEDVDVYSGEGLPGRVEVAGGSLTVKIRPFEDKQCYVSFLELVSLDKKDDLDHVIVRGRESLVINEVMPKPSFRVAVSEDQDPKGDWVWKGGFYQNSEFGGGQSGEGRWTFDINKRGYFYVILLGAAPGGYIGDASIAGNYLSDARNGMRFPSAVFINDTFSITIQNTSLVEVATFKGMIISQEPDTEFIEILNLSSQSLDIGGFSLEVTPKAGASLGWPAVIPQNTQIGPYQHLVLAVDSSDSGGPAFLNGNGISFQRTWGQSSVQLQFTGAVDGNDDIVPNEEAVVTLKDPTGLVVASLEYKSGQVKDFTSIERGDPTLFTDSDVNGLFDGWYFSEDLAKATPAQRNDNAGIKEIDPVTLEVFYHDPSEQAVENKYFINIGYADDVASSLAWQKFGIRDIALLSDRFTSSLKPLGVNSYIGGGFLEVSQGFRSISEGHVGTWIWPSIPKGIYALNILASEDTTSSISLAVGLNGDLSQYLGPFSFDRALVRYGSIEILDNSEELEIKVRNEENEPVTIVNFILEPKSQVRGRININTADQKVLRTITDTTTASRITSLRPYGQRTGRRSGIGDLLQDIAREAFRKIVPFITVRSDVYEVISYGEYIAGRMPTRHRVETIIER